MSQIIGICGGSGSGKTTFAQALQEALGADLCEVIYQDSYYYDLSQKFDFDGGRVNFDHPSAIDFKLMAQHLHALKENQSVEIPLYDFKTHARLEPTQHIEPKPYIIVDGILIFSQPQILDQLDFKIFINTPELTRYSRRLFRDTRERGRTPEGVRNQFLKQVKPMHDQFVEPTQSSADQIVSGKESFDKVIESIVVNFQKSAPCVESTKGANPAKQ